MCNNYFTIAVRRTYKGNVGESEKNVQRQFRKDFPYRSNELTSPLIVSQIKHKIYKIY